MKKIIGLLLIAGGLYLGYEGYNQYNKSSKSLSIGKLELSATNEKGAQTAYMYIGGGLVLLLAGVYLVRK